MVECQLPKLNVAGSSPVTRFPKTWTRKSPSGQLGTFGLIARLNQLQHLWANAAGAALAIERTQNQTCCVFDFTMFGSLFSRIGMA